MAVTPSGSLDIFGPGRKLGQCVACPVHSYINHLSLPMESMNHKIKLVFSMFCHISCQSLYIPLNRVLHFVHISFVSHAT